MAALPLMELVFMQLAKAAPALLSSIPDLMLASGAAATIAGSAGSGSMSSATPPSTTPAPPPASAGASESTVTPGSNGSSVSSGEQSIRGQFPSYDFNHPYLWGSRQTMDLAYVQRYGFDMALYDRILQQEYRILGRYFGLLPTVVESSPVLAQLAMPAVTGVGSVFTEATSASILSNPAIMEEVRLLRGRPLQTISSERESSILAGNSIVRDAFTEAREALEIKNEMPIPAESFARSAAAARITPSRVSQAYNAIASRIRDRETMRRVLSKWLYNKLLPGMAGAGVTWALERVFSDVTPEHSNREVTPHQIEQSAIQRELDVAFADLGFADVFSVLPDADQPSEGSVHWTPNPIHNYGVGGSVIPRKSSVYPVAPAVPLSLDPILGQKLTGDGLSERYNDSRAKRSRTSLEVPTNFTPTVLPVVPPSNDDVDRNIQTSALTSQYGNKGGLRAVHRVKVIPTLAEKPETTQPEITRNFDATYTQSVPSTITGPTSGRPEDYTGTNRPYKQTLSDAPNVVGMGYDESQTERFLMDMVTSDESKLPTTPSAGTTTVPYSVSVADTKNPLFANVGVPLPTETPQPAIMPRQL